MLYCIEGKIYLLVNNKYKEVTISKKANEYNVDVLNNGKVVEKTSMQHYPQVSIEYAYKISKSKSKF